jgi:hypothetical protein
VDSPIAALTGQMTRENPGRGYKPIQGELKPPQSLARQFTEPGRRFADSTPR